MAQQVLIPDHLLITPAYGRNLSHSNLTHLLHHPDSSSLPCFSEFGHLLVDAGDAVTSAYATTPHRQAQQDQGFVPAYRSGQGSPASSPSQSWPPQLPASDMLQPRFMDINPALPVRMGVHHAGGVGGEPQCSLSSVEPPGSLSSDQAGLNGRVNSNLNVSVHHHPHSTVLSQEEMMSSEMEEWGGLSHHHHPHQHHHQHQHQHQHQHLHHQHQHQLHQQQQGLDANLSYSSPVSALLSSNSAATSARPGPGMNGRLVSMRQQMNAPPLNVVVPPMPGFSNTNLNIMSPGLLSNGAMLEGGSSSVNRMMPDGSIVRELFSSRQGQGQGQGQSQGQGQQQLSPSLPPTSFPMFNSAAAASAAIDRVLSRASSWVTPSMDATTGLALDGATCLPMHCVSGARLATSHCLAQFSSDPGFAERAARFSSFTNNGGSGSGSGSSSSPNASPTTVEAKPLPRTRATAASPTSSPNKTAVSSPSEGKEDSKLCRTNSCPPLGNAGPSSAAAAAAAEDVKPATNCDAAPTNSSSSNAPPPPCMEADNRSPSGSPGHTESKNQQQAGAAFDKKKGASGTGRNSSSSPTPAKRLARTSSCPSAVAKLPLEEVAKMEPGLEPRKLSTDANEQSSDSEREEGSSDGQGKKRKCAGQAEKMSATSTAPDTSPASTTKSSKSGDNEETVVVNPKRSRGDKDPKTDRSCSDSGDSTSPRSVKEPAKPPEVPKPDYIHVRARRGQATDSHSLAERVRREKISERMKFLQDLVPGCSKVTGKAVMLDEIISYVQSLQRQVEFLSVKLASVNPRMDFNMDPILSREMLHQSRGMQQQQQMIMGPDTLTMSSPFAGHLIHHQQQHSIPMLMVGACGMQQMVGTCGMQQMVGACGADLRSMGTTPMEGLRRTISAPMSPHLDSYGEAVSLAQRHECLNVATLDDVYEY